MTGIRKNYRHIHDQKNAASIVARENIDRKEFVKLYGQHPPPMIIKRFTSYFAVPPRGL
ncbi:hypothetical protein ABH904_002555 [Pseudomonas frederiksbergensis]